jgi:hypothetical protein
MEFLTSFKSNLIVGLFLFLNIRGRDGPTTIGYTGLFRKNELPLRMVGELIQEGGAKSGYLVQHDILQLILLQRLWNQ